MKIYKFKFLLTSINLINADACSTLDGLQPDFLFIDFCTLIVVGENKYGIKYNAAKSSLPIHNICINIKTT